MTSLLSCICFGIQAEFMGAKLDVLGPEAGPYQQWPEVALVVVHLVVIHFFSRRKPELECRELQKGLSTPVRHVDESPTSNAEATVNFHQDLLGEVKVLKYGIEDN